MGVKNAVAPQALGLGAGLITSMTSMQARVGRGARERRLALCQNKVEGEV